MRGLRGMGSGMEGERARVRARERGRMAEGELCGQGEEEGLCRQEWELKERWLTLRSLSSIL
jgi:hypothetical protein